MFHIIKYIRNVMITLLTHICDILVFQILIFDDNKTDTNIN